MSWGFGKPLQPRPPLPCVVMYGKVIVPFGGTTGEEVSHRGAELSEKDHSTSENSAPL